MSSCWCRWSLFLVAQASLGCSPVRLTPGQPDDAERVDIGPMALTVGTVTPGDTITLTVSGVGVDEDVVLFESEAVPGPGPCYGTLGTFCLDIQGPVIELATVRSGADGVASHVWTVPESVPVGQDLSFQAVVRRGVSGLSWSKSPAVGVRVFDAPLTVPGLHAGDLLITEVMLDPVAVDDTVGEWIEVQNVSELDANLDGLTLFDGLDAYVLPSTTFLGAGERMVFGLEADPLVNGGVVVDRVLPGLSLADQWGEFALLAGPLVIDAVAWDDGVSFPLEPGHTLNLYGNRDHLDNDYGENWCVSDVRYGAGDFGTPKADNDSCYPLALGVADADATVTGLSTNIVGAGLVAAGDTNGDGYDDMLFVNGWSGYLVQGPLLGVLSVSRGDAHFLAAHHLTAAGAGDVDHDGYDDLLFGTKSALPTGVAYLLEGPIEGDLDPTDAYLQLDGEQAGEDAGTGLAGVGDVDGDGYDDIAVSAPDHGTNGIVYLLRGPLPPGDLDLYDAAVRITGDLTTTDRAGLEVVGAGDLNGDGFDDLLISGSRTVYVAHGPVDRDLDLVGADAKIVSDSWRAISASPVGDADGDGNDDLLVWSTSAVCLLYGPVIGEIDLVDRCDVAFAGGSYMQDAAGAGDLDGDGRGDLVFMENDGLVHILYGSLDDDTVDLPTQADATIALEDDCSSLDTHICEVIGAGDVDADGRRDILIRRASTAYLFLGASLP